VKKYFFLLIIFISQIKIAHADYWTQMASFTGVKRCGAFSLSIGNKGYMGTGRDVTNTIYYDDFWEYDPVTNAWTQKANFAGAPRFLSIAFSIAGKGYAGLGGLVGGSVFNDFYEYDPVTNIWTLKANFGGVARMFSCSFVIGNTGYAGIGTDNAFTTFYNDLWAYDPVTDTWTAKANYTGAARSDAVAFAIGTKGYIGTGYNGGMLTDFWQYDSAIDAWSAIANFPSPLYDASAFTICDKGFVATGYGSSSFVNEIWQYDTTANVWTPKVNFSGIARDIAVCFAINNKGYLGIGWQDGIVWYDDLWEYTPDSTICGSTVPPVVNFTASERHICPGTCIAFTNLSQFANSYQWFFNGATPDTSTGVNPQNICYNTPGSYDVTLIATNAVGTDTVTLSNLIQVFPQPVTPAFTQSGDTLFATAGYVTYQWYFASDTIAGATNYFYVATQSGNYNLVVTDENGCSVGAGIVNVVAGIFTLSFVGGWGEVFPNPAKNNFTITMVNGLSSMVCIKLFNSFGEVVYSADTKENTTEISTHSFAEGIYLLNVTGEGKIFTEKLIIVR
jgi:PKD repeat protein